MTAPDATAVPDEADIVIPDVLHIAVNAATPVYINAEGDDEGCASAVVLAALIALAEAGWVLVPGPVHTEWGAAHEGQENTDNPRAVAMFSRFEAAARVYVEGRPSSMRVVTRQVTDWRPAPTQESAG